MQSVLAIDSTTAGCSVALKHKGEVRSLFKLASREHTRLLLPMVDELLSEVDMSLRQLDALVFTHGPGSFTGIRIGFGIVQGLALGADIPVVPVSSLETLAYTAARKLSLQTDCTLMAMFDARMDEIYWAQFEWRDGQVERQCEDSLTAPEYVTVNASTLPLLGIGDGWHYGERIPLQPTSLNVDLLPDARDALTVAWPDVVRGNLFAIDEVQPLYLRDRVSWKKRQRLRPSSGTSHSGGDVA